VLINGEYSCVTVPLIRLLSDILQIYSEEDRSKMPLELSSALSHDREAVEDSEIRQQTLEAIYMIVLQVFQYSMVVALVSLWMLTPIIQIFSAALF